MTWGKEEGGVYLYLALSLPIIIPHVEFPPSPPYVCVGGGGIFGHLGIPAHSQLFLAY
jgi:hypothetical protein